MVFYPITKVVRKEPHSPIEDEEFLGYLSLMPGINATTGLLAGHTFLHQLKQANRIPKESV